MAVLNFQPQTSLRFQIGRLCLFLDPLFSAIWCCSTFTNKLNIKYELQISLSFCFSAVTFITNLRCYMLLYFHRTAACAALFLRNLCVTTYRKMVQWLSLASVLLTVMQTVASAAGYVCLTQTLPLPFTFLSETPRFAFSHTFRFCQRSIGFSFS